MTSSAAPVYRFFKRADGQPAPVRVLVATMIAIACAAVTLGALRVASQHDVLRLGYELAKENAQLSELREARRRLELELATLSAPARIRRLATELGMAPIAPDCIRIVDVPHREKVASQP